MVCGVSMWCVVWRCGVRSDCEVCCVVCGVSVWSECVV